MSTVEKKPEMRDCYDMVSDAYRNHLGIVGAAMFGAAISRRLLELESGAQGRDPGQLETALRIAGDAGYDCMFSRYCAELAAAERRAISGNPQA